ncbi:MAG TPA: YbaK/EbsC family protein [Acidimicrobiia bacterium]|nr:YbaK/EbsC family protein [Acidimicrobiia bacterium]
MPDAPAVNPEPDPRVVVALDTIGLPYELMACDPELADTAAFCAAYGVPPERSANTIVVSSKRPEGRRAVCVVLATNRLDVNGEVRRRLGVKKASFASPEETVAITGMMIGGVTPFGLPPDIPVWVDSRVMTPDWVILGAGTRRAKVKVAPVVLAALPAVEVVDGLGLGGSGPGGGPPQQEAVAGEPDDGEGEPLDRV